ncbi:hypothetical protein EDC65_4072 [Stella humosa]|uniref:Uncharacterized protein n=1 Tax=Stella humosa TaxID=94 RepID=A0A3N1L1N4_9PROT|nr:hypothetical protein [Stella humosa]ROP83425.1 hypothetical protein EDC65_4072 [Stella humosa]BBK33303.1 hypothetical protein STHU_39370 [Stella humosa]
MTIRSTALAAVVLLCTALLAAADTYVTVRATFQNDSGTRGWIKATNPNDGARSDDNPSSLSGGSAYTAPDIVVRLNGMIPSQQWNFIITLDDGRQCRAAYFINTNSCPSSGYPFSERGAKCDSASSWTGTTCQIALNIKD